MKMLHDQYIKINSKFNSDNSLIIQSFISFYGEQHKEYILKKLSNSRIIWYDDKELDETEDVHNHIISSIPVEEINELLKKRSKKAFLQSAYIDELDLLVLPLSYDLTHIIHESNHKVGSHVLSYEPLVQINGISYSKETNNGVIEHDEFLSEAINHKMTLEILSELNDLGIEVKRTPSWQENLFPLINLFYETFKDLLKETFISGDLNGFVKLLGEDNYSYFSQMIYLKGFKIRRQLRKGDKPEISQEDIDLIEGIVHKMKSHYELLSDNEIRKK